MKNITLECPLCGCTETIGKGKKGKFKVKRFPKTHFIRFACGFAFLYNDKNNKIFIDSDWACNKSGRLNTAMSIHDLENGKGKFKGFNKNVKAYFDNIK